MTDPKKGPVVVGPKVDLTKDPHLQRVKAGVEARAAQARAARPPIGNLAQADKQSSPGKDGPMTIELITSAQRAVDNGEKPAGGGLKPETVEAIKAVAAASQAARDKLVPKSQQPKPPAPVAPKKETRMTDAAPEPEKKPTEKKPTEDEARKLRTQLDEIDDLDVERIMRGIQNDVINNEKERKAAKERASEIDFANGMANNEFTQDVDIIPDKLKVTFRTITPLENQGIRLWLIQRATEDPRFDKLAGEVYGLALVVASIVKIGGTQYPQHLSGQAPNQEFDVEAFVTKYDRFIKMPAPLIHALATHSQWFDLRVREMFTTDYAKNG